MKQFTLIMLFVVSAFSAFSQTRRISGTVTDSTTGTALPGVTVRILHSQAGTQTDARGNFSLEAPSAGSVVLQFSYLGYETREKAISGSTASVVPLSPHINNINEVVVVGYGEVKKRDLTGSVVSIKGEEVTKVPTTNVMESLQGKIPGADIVRSNGSSNSGTSVLLRGHRSLAGGNDPLYIVDGAIYSHIEDINPSDVQSVEVLKDASATAIYGSRGANGVIIVTTKNGALGAPKVSLNVYGGFTDVAEYPHYMTGPQYVEFQRQAYRTTGKWNSPADDPNIFNAAELNDIKNNTWTNYRDLLIHRGNEQNYEVNVSGGTEKTKAFFSAGFNRNKGLFKFDHTNKYTARLNITHQVSRLLQAGMTSQITFYDISTEADPLNEANKIIPLGAPYDSTGALAIYPENGPQLNPLVNEAIPNNYADNTKTSRVLATGFVQLDPIEGLSLRSNISVALNNSREGIFNGQYSLSRNGGDPRSQYQTSRGTDLLWENIITYKRQFGDHHIDLTGVTSYQSDQSDNGNGQGDGQLIPSQLYYGLGNATAGLIASTGYVETRLISFTGRINYDWKGKYLLTLTGRTDGSSKLAPGNKWAFFPSAAAAWRLSQEHFLQQSKTISNLKLRASYGVAGNDPLDAYSIQSLLTNISFGFGETPAPGYGFSPQIGNKDLKWELSGTTDIGLDLGLWNDRVSATIDWYDTHTSDLLLPRLLPTSTGVQSVVQNIGKTENTGVEISISTVNIQSHDFKWSSALTFTSNKEKIVSLATGGQNDIADGWFIGHPTSVFFDYQKVGIWQTDQADEAAKFGQTPGTIHAKDVDGDGKITTSDRVILGAAVPKWSGGLSNTVNYRNFDLNVYIFARIGQMINANYLRFKSGTYENQAMHDYWTPENPTNAFPRPNSNGGLQYLSTLQYVSGSFAKIRLISLGYTLPRTLTDSWKMSQVRLYVTAKDPFTFSRTTDYDPERGGSENFPMTRSFLLGANIDF